MKPLHGQINISSFKLTSSGICHSNKKLAQLLMCPILWSRIHFKEGRHLQMWSLQIMSSDFVFNLVYCSAAKMEDQASTFFPRWLQHLAHCHFLTFCYSPLIFWMFLDEIMCVTELYQKRPKYELYMPNTS